MTRPIFLIGFMAVGKTTVGRALAEHLGWRFVDLDDVIAAAAGASVASLVAADEADFRRREQDALVQVCAQAAAGGLVVATGGGCAAHGDNVERMRASGLVVALTAALPEVRRRAAGGPARPLLGDDAGAAALLATRLPAYRRAHATVPTDGAGVAEVVSAVAAAAAASAAVPLPELAATVALGPRSYPVRVCAALPGGGELLAPLGAQTQRAVLIDGNVAARWAAALHAAEPALGPPAGWHVIAPGEASKSIATYHAVCDALVAAGLDRTSALVGIGGGVVGDLAGFIAATLFRGVPIVHLPTTIVAMTDSAIGGKTGLDLAAGKNLVGAFWQPRLVSAHLPLLATLPGRERRAGFGELWKYGLLTGGVLWDLVAAHAGWAAAGDDAPVPPSLGDVIARAAAAKAWVVSVDERERTGQRVLLNLGHTVGHAIEAEHGLLHGEAVGLGLVAACVVSHALGLAPPDLAGEVAARLGATGLASDPRAYLTEATLARLGVDKKRAGSRVRFVAIHDVGRCAPVDVEVDELRRILRSHPAV